MFLFPVDGRNQSRGVVCRNGLVFGVAASKGFDEPPIAADDVARHAQGAFARMDELLESAVLRRSDVQFVQVYLHDVLRDVDGFNSVWREYFSALNPARCCVGATLQSGMLVEMMFVAQRSDNGS